MRLAPIFAPFLLLFTLNQVHAASKTSISAPHVKIDLLEVVPSVSQGGIPDSVSTGIRFRPDPGWHVYWKNPGDSGAAPKFQIEAENAEVTGPFWPYPKRLPVAHLTNIGYEGEVAYIFHARAKTKGPIQIRFGLEWLVCKEECVPGFGELTLDADLLNSRGIVKASAVYDFESLVPERGDFSPYRLAIATTEDGRLKLTVKSTEVVPPSLEVFPVDVGYAESAKPERVGDDFYFKVMSGANRPESLNFVLVTNGRGYEFTGVPFASVDVRPELLPFLILLLSALAGGILLNLMPCVFPILSVKAMSLLKNSDARSRRRDGWLYSLGVISTFALLGILILVLRSAGSAVGWGFQLQSPVVILGLSVLFWLMALNFLGVFEIGTSVMNASGDLSSRSAWRSSFGTGVLSVFVAAPCTGPFMGTALGATATLPALYAMPIFVALGLGLALPYWALTFFPRLGRVLPRPGAWMETLKEFFAFPLFATVIWLLWVLGMQLGAEGWTYAVAALFVVSFALWLGKRPAKFWKPVAWVLAAVALVAIGTKLRETKAPIEARDYAAAWQPYTDDAIKTSERIKQSVFVDFTAAWCITCQVNKKAVLETTEADEFFKKHGILRLRADWTLQDPLITAALDRLGRNSVPVYAFYDKDDPRFQPKLLPQILTMQMIRDLIPKEKQ